MSKPVVAVVKYSDPVNSLREALELCAGLKGLDKNDSILIKPNLVAWDYDAPFSPFGVVTTTSLIFALVRILAEEGFGKITIGEGAVRMPGYTGRRLYKTLGYEKLTERYGVDLVDFNEEKFEARDFGGFKLSVAKRALEADKIINAPVLKTHTQCKVSLGIKNLKGCIDQKSKMACHGKDVDLDHTFPLVADQLPVALTIIDGIYTLERGPLQSGRAYRKDLIIASGDLLAADMAGADLLGYPAGQVEHLRFFADRRNRGTDLKDIQVAGEDIERHRVRLPHAWEWAEDNTGPAEIKKMGIKGLAVRKYDHTLCTGCSFQYSPVLYMMLNAFRGQPSLPSVEVITGKSQVASGGFDRTVLFGKCAIAQNKNNPGINRAVPVKGCPPDLREFAGIMRQEGINCSFDDYAGYRRHVLNRYLDKEDFDLNFYIKE